MTSKYTVGRSLLMFLVAVSLLLTASYSHAHSGSLNKVAVDVCKQKEKSQSCQYQGVHSDLYIGTCQLISETDLICVRNQPIQKIESTNTDTKKDKAEEHKH